MLGSKTSGNSFRDKFKPNPDEDEAGETAMTERDEVETPDMKLKHKVGVRLRNKARAAKKAAPKPKKVLDTDKDGM